MVDIKDAVQAAKVFAANVLEPPRNSRFLLEEVQLENLEGREVWRITLSHPKPVLTPTELMADLTDSRARDYKTFAVDAENGTVISMKIRELAHAE